MTTTNDTGGDFFELVAELETTRPEPPPPEGDVPAECCSECGGTLGEGDDERCFGCHTRQTGRRLIRGALEGPSIQLAAGVPAVLWETDFLEPESWPADPRQRDYTLDRWDGRHPSTWLLSGPVGVGKSMFAAEVLRRLVRRRLEAELARLATPRRCDNCGGRGHAVVAEGEEPPAGSWAATGGRSVCGRRCGWARGASPQPGSLPSLRPVWCAAATVPDARFSHRRISAYDTERDDTAHDEFATGVARVLRTVGHGGPTWEELIAADVLVLDDLGRSHSGGRWEPVGELVAARHAAGSTTLLTSNLSLAEIGEVHPHAADRLAGGCVSTLSGDTRRELTIPNHLLDPRPRLVKS